MKKIKTETLLLAGGAAALGYYLWKRKEKTAGTGGSRSGIPFAFSTGPGGGESSGVPWNLLPNPNPNPTPSGSAKEPAYRTTYPTSGSNSGERAKTSRIVGLFYPHPRGDVVPRYDVRTNPGVQNPPPPPPPKPFIDEAELRTRVQQWIKTHPVDRATFQWLIQHGYLPHGYYTPTNTKSNPVGQGYSLPVYTRSDVKRSTTPMPDVNLSGLNRTTRATTKASAAASKVTRRTYAIGAGRMAVRKNIVIV